MMPLAYSTRLSGAAAEPVRQTSWYVDHENGDDRAPGTIGDPVESIREIARRTRGMVFDEDVSPTYTITCAVGSTPNPENVTLTPVFNGAVNLFIRSVPVPMFSGAMTSGTLEWSDSGHQEVNAVCSGIPTSWTASDLVGKQIRISSGDRAGNATFAAYDMGSKTVRCAGWMHPDYYNDTAVSGDSFDVCDIARYTGHWVVQTIGPGAVWFEDIEIGTRGNQHSLECRGFMNASRARINGCDILEGGSMYLIGCYVGDGLRQTYGSCAIELTAMVRPSGSVSETRIGGSMYVYEQCLAQGLGMLVSGGKVFVDSSGSVSSCDASFAYSMSTQSMIDCAGYMWSRNASSRVLSVVGPMSSIGYTSGRVPLNVGTGSPTLLVLAGSSYASLPRTDANSLANVVVRA
jgi:hypothetical protein